MQRIARTRGVKGAAACCAFATFFYLIAKLLLTALVNFLVGLRVSGATLASPVGISQVSVEFFVFLIGAGAIAVPVFWLLAFTRLTPDELRLTIPGRWSPAFCLPVFLGLANAANLFGSLFARLTGGVGGSVALPAGGPELAATFLTLCVLPAIAEELLFRGALQGLMRPCGSGAAIFTPALLFALLHGDFAQGMTAFACAVFLGWLAERTGSILPGMLLHFTNNVLAFLNIYLHMYAPGNVALGYTLVLLLGFPALALWLLCHAERQGFRFAQGMRPGVAPLAALGSPVYTVAAVFFVVLNIFTGVL